MALIISEVIAMDFFQILVVDSPGPYAQTKTIFFTNIFRFRSHGTLYEPKLQNATHCSLKSLLNTFNLFLNFLLMGPHKSTVLDF